MSQAMLLSTWASFLHSQPLGFPLTPLTNPMNPEIADAIDPQGQRKESGIITIGLLCRVRGLWKSPP